MRTASTLEQQCLGIVFLKVLQPKTTTTTTSSTQASTKPIINWSTLQRIKTTNITTITTTLKAQSFSQNLLSFLQHIRLRISWIKVSRTPQSARHQAQQPHQQRNLQRFHTLLSHWSQPQTQSTDHSQQSPLTIRSNSIQQSTIILQLPTISQSHQQQQQQRTMQTTKCPPTYQIRNLAKIFSRIPSTSCTKTIHRLLQSPNRIK